MKKIPDQYITMVSAAAEIQALRPNLPNPSKSWISDFQTEDPEQVIGSLFACDGILKSLHWDNDEGRWIIGGYYDDPKSMTWIPRLDDLVVILGTFGEFRRLLAYWADSIGGRDEWHEATLVLIMREKYGKVWNGETWVKKTAEYIDKSTRRL